MGEHLDRSQIVLAELVNATPGTFDPGEERTRARELLSENRLLRQTATHTGDLSDAALLDELDEPFEHLRLAGEVAVEGGFRNIELRRQQCRGDFFAGRVFQHFGNGLQNLQLAVSAFSHIAS